MARVQRVARYRYRESDSVVCYRKRHADSARYSVAERCKSCSQRIASSLNLSWLGFVPAKAELNFTLRSVAKRNGDRVQVFVGHTGGRWYSATRKGGTLVRGLKNADRNRKERRGYKSQQAASSLMARAVDLRTRQRYDLTSLFVSNTDNQSLAR